MSVRSVLREQVFGLADNQCEHPRRSARMIAANGRANAHQPIYGRCHRAAVELAHIYPRGMGHTGYRDTIENVIAACFVHARSTDDLSSAYWRDVPAPHDRKALTEWVRQDRVRRGYTILEDFDG